uniref:ATP-dependent DNA helicase n=1 Tax=Romanomermis culicivorax TaxID=13658 RepID=A0A915J739_ROMCU
MFVKNSSKDRFDLWCSLCDKVRRFDAIPDDYLTNNLPERLVSTYTEINRRVSLSGADNLPKKDFYTKALNSFTQFKDGAETETPSKISPELVENTSMLTDLFPNMFTDDTSLLDTGLTTVIIPDPIEIDNAAQDTAEILLSLSRNGQNSVQ